MQLEIVVTKAAGIPAPESTKGFDVVERSALLCICYCQRAKRNKPDYRGNCYKILAQRDTESADSWKFSSTDQVDASNQLIVRFSLPVDVTSDDEAALLGNTQQRKHVAFESSLEGEQKPQKTIKSSDRVQSVLGARPTFGFSRSLDKQDTKRVVKSQDEVLQDMDAKWQQSDDELFLCIELCLTLRIKKVDRKRAFRESVRSEDGQDDESASGCDSPDNTMSKGRFQSLDRAPMEVEEVAPILKTMSCGWCMLPLQTLGRLPGPRNCQGTVQGGTPFCAAEIDAEDIRASTRGWGAFKLLLGRKVSSSLSVRVIPTNRMLDGQLVRSIHV
jgi:hypothetical protein